MGTRSTVSIFDDGGKTNILKLFGMWEGQYADGVGENIEKYLRNKYLVNGIPSGCDELLVFNGMSDLALRLAVHLKGDNDKAGGWYCSTTCSKDEYNHYQITQINGAIIFEHYIGGNKSYTLKMEAPHGSV